MSDAAYEALGMVVVGLLFAGTLAGLIFAARGSTSGYAALLTFVALSFGFGMLGLVVTVANAELARSVLIWLFIVGSVFQGIAGLVLCLGPVRRYLASRGRVSGGPGARPPAS